MKNFVSIDDPRALGLFQWDRIARKAPEFSEEIARDRAEWIKHFDLGMSFEGTPKIAEGHAAFGRCGELERKWARYL